MPRASWPVAAGRPVVKVELVTANDRSAERTLLADTGAGTLDSRFDVVLGEADCLLGSDRPFGTVTLRGAFHGCHFVYMARLRIPRLDFDHHVRAVAAPSLPPGLDGIARFNFLSNFTFGNFGVREQFGLETR